MKRLITSFLIAAAVTGVVSAPSAAQVVSTCDPQVVMNHRLAEIGTGGYTWSIGLINLNVAGHVDRKTRTVKIIPQVSCDLMTTVVNHEWMHVQQYLVTDSLTHTYGTIGQAERVADCGSAMMGSTLMPYLDETGPCTTEEFKEARKLIDDARLSINIHV